MTNKFRASSQNAFHATGFKNKSTFVDNSDNK